MLSRLGRPETVAEENKKNSTRLNIVHVSCRINWREISVWDRQQCWTSFSDGYWRDWRKVNGPCADRDRFYRCPDDPSLNLFRRPRVTHISRPPPPPPQRFFSYTIGNTTTTTADVVFFVRRGENDRQPYTHTHTHLHAPSANKWKIRIYFQKRHWISRSIELVMDGRCRVAAKCVVL